MEVRSGTNGTVHSDKGRLYTLSADPGRRVYNERLVSHGGSEYREWSPSRSKLAAYLVNGGSTYPFNSASRILYLGAANGTTVSHVSDIASNGVVYAVEFSQRSFRDLVRMSQTRGNVNPILADATDPGQYSFAVERVDVVYSDVAQKHQADILADNMDMYGARWGMLCIKASSEDVTVPPESVFEMSRRRLTERGLKVRETLSLEPYERHHMMMVVERPRTSYVVAFDDSGDFLMVYHPRRRGWEMPGGKVEPGEGPEEASVRECREEAGYSIEVLAVSDIGYCDVCAARIVERVGQGEMESRMFTDIPDNLSFGREEYETVVPWARGVVLRD